MNFRLLNKLHVGTATLAEPESYLRSHLRLSERRDVVVVVVVVIVAIDLC